MDLEKVKKSVSCLELLLNSHALSDQNAARLLGLLTPLINKVKASEIPEPMEWRDIPGGYFFAEGKFSGYRDLEKAFAEFRIEITGGDNPVLEMMQLKIQ